MSKTLDEVNGILAAYPDAAFGLNHELSAGAGTVAFSSGLGDWAFTLDTFAVRYCRRFGMDREKLAHRLWGDNYFNPKTRRWTTERRADDGTLLERAFNMFVLDPIYKIFAAVMGSKKETLAVCPSASALSSLADRSCISFFSLCSKSSTSSSPRTRSTSRASPSSRPCRSSSLSAVA